MICKKIPHPLLISLCAVLPALFFTLFSFSSSAFATSVTCNMSWHTTGGNEDFSSCDLSSLSSPVYFDGTLSLVSDSTQVTSYSSAVTFFPSATSFNENYPSFALPSVYFNKVYSPSAQINLSYSFTGSVPFIPTRLRVMTSNSIWVTYSFNGTFSDEPIGGGSSEPCPDCPEIPENPYDNKLDEIKQAILLVPAMLLVIYFLFCLYQILIKNGGRK